MNNCKKCGAPTGDSKFCSDACQLSYYKMLGHEHTKEKEEDKMLEWHTLPELIDKNGSKIPQGRYKIVFRDDNKIDVEILNTFGIAHGINEMNEELAFIANSNGQSEQRDLNFICCWGAKINVDVAKSIIKSHGTILDNALYV